MGQLILFGTAAPSSGEFQEIEGESEERRKARLDRHQRTQERAVYIFLPFVVLFEKQKLWH